jgi:hypothetical protein
MDTYYKHRGLKLDVPKGRWLTIHITRDTSPKPKALLNYVDITDDPEELIACIAGRFYPMSRCKTNSRKLFVYAGTDRNRMKGVCFNPDHYVEMRATKTPAGYLLEIDANNDGSYYMLAEVTFDRGLNKQTEDHVEA